jgi:hypothetical protein
MSDSKDSDTLLQRHNKALLEASIFNKAAVFDALATAGMNTVIVTFNGEGDDGQIEDITADDSAQIPGTRVELLHTPGWGASKLDSAQSTLRNAIETLCYDYLSQEHGGWENNDGAFGEFTFSVADRTIALEFNGRFSDFHTSTHTF